MNETEGVFAIFVYCAECLLSWASIYLSFRISCDNEDLRSGFSRQSLLQEPAAPFTWVRMWKVKSRWEIASLQVRICRAWEGQSWNGGVLKVLGLIIVSLEMWKHTLPHELISFKFLGPLCHHAGCRLWDTHWCRVSQGFDNQVRVL